MNLMKYFKAYWSENRGDEYSDWGGATYFFEIDVDLYPTKQIEVYDNAYVLKYDSNHFYDEYGMLGDQALEIGLEFTEISQEEFEKVWNSHIAINK